MMKAWLQRFMYGRYGADQLNMALMILFLVIALTTPLLKNNLPLILNLVLLVLIYLRMFSRNISKRYAENQKFLKIWNPIRNKFRFTMKHTKERKDYRFYKCPNCKQKVRVPKGRGEITITCPKCHTKFDKRT